MKLKTRPALLVGILVLILAPTAAFARGVEYETEAPPKSPGPSASTGEKAKAYGKYCRAFSKTHVAGEKGTPFSNCATAMARAATTKRSARAVCAGFSKAPVKGQPGTPFAKCVTAAATVKRQLT